jgi:uncharacterized protein YukJ
MRGELKEKITIAFSYPIFDGYLTFHKVGLTFAQLVELSTTGSTLYFIGLNFTNPMTETILDFRFWILD